nr:hypothetical protein [Tanacetum cinerariifolium]
MTHDELRAQVEQLAAYAKRAKILEVYNHCINFRDDSHPITKFSYWVNNSIKKATIRITSNNQPPNLTIYDKFVLKKLRFSEWLDLHDLAYKRTLTLPQGVIGKDGMVIRELEAGIFLYNGNFDLVFQRSEQCLKSTTQLIRIQNLITVDSEYAQQVYDELTYEIEARPDFIQAREIVEKNLDASNEGLDECKASASNLGCIQVKHCQGSQRLLEDILVSWDGYQLVCRRNTLMVLKRVRSGNTRMILLPFGEEQVELKLL